MSASSKKVIYAALIGNSLIAITKFVAASVTGSSAMLSEGIHSAVDTGNQILLLHGMKRAGKPADENFPFGYGKEIYFWSFVVAIMIFAVGAGVSIYEGISHLTSHSELGSPRINYIVLGLAFVFEGVALWIAFKEFSHAKGKRGYWQAVKHGKDPTLFVVLFEDSAAMLGIIVAFIGVWLAHVTGSSVYDSAASIIIGLILGGTAVLLAIETKGLLIGESANPRIVNGIRELVQSKREILKVNEVLTMHVGPDFILVNLSVEFQDNATAIELEHVGVALDTTIKERFPRVKRVFIEAESWAKTSLPD